jgi:predicted DNA binding CopG/RHH family protein
MDDGLTLTPRRPPVVRPGTKAKNLNIRLTAAQLEQIHERASEQGVTVSDYVRESALSQKGA